MALIVESRPPADICTGYFQISSGTSVFTVTAPAFSRWAKVTVETQNIRYRADGVAPTTTTGMLVTAGSSILIGLSDWSKLQGIPVTSGGVWNIEFYSDRTVGG
jgi:hypothetical protein